MVIIIRSTKYIALPIRPVSQHGQCHITNRRQWGYCTRFPFGMWVKKQCEIPGVTQVEKGHAAGNTVTAYVGRKYGAWAAVVLLLTG